MRTIFRRTLPLVLAVAVVGGLVVAFVEARKEQERDKDLEKPVKPPRRVSRGPEGEILVTLDEETEKRIGLAVESPAPVSLRPDDMAYGVILDPESLLTLAGDLEAAEAALVASEAAHKRAKGLGDNVAAKTLEAAEAQYRSDEARVRSLRRQIASTWGDAGTLPMDKLARREIALARVTLAPGQEHSAPQSARVGEVKASAIYPAPSVDARLRTRAFILRLDVPGFAPGMAVEAILEFSGVPIEGVRVPRAAVLRWSGKTWVYVRMSGHVYTRREIDSIVAAEDSWFVREGLTPKGYIVTTGAGLLLSEELKYQIQVEAD